VEYIYDEKVELGRGGMAVVYEATHPKRRGTVALKRPLPFPNAPERLRREIEALTRVDHPHVMPVVDHGVDESGEPWYAMPVAPGSLRALWEDGALGTDVEALCRDVLEEVCAGLSAMHAAGYVHRDVTPNNVLGFRDDARTSGFRWVVADCGLARRPLGETTVGLTGSVSRLGTDGYMAPETLGDPHSATESADIYSLGRVLAFLLTGRRPIVNTPLLPDDGPWRPVVRLFTRPDPADRPRTAREAVDLAREILAGPPESDKVTFRVQIAERGGELASDNALWGIVEDHLDDEDFMLDDLPTVRPRAARRLAAARPEFAAAVAEKLAGHVVAAASGDWSARNFDSYNLRLDWIKAVLEGLQESQRLELFGDIAPAYCRAVEAWDRYSHNNELVRWLGSLTAPAATRMAAAIRHSGATDYFRRITEGRRISDPTLAAVLGR
jgi:serine/threonine protein kinase